MAQTPDDDLRTLFTYLAGVLESLGIPYMVFVWGDEKNAVEVILAMPGGKAKGITSKEDANEMLQRGSLAEFIA
jgi:hypothetical protein